MDAEVFLSCSNLTLGQYRAIALTRGLTGAAGCVVSLAVLGIVLLTIRKKAWENLPKRIYLAIVLYTLLFSIVAIAAVNYSHPPSQESSWCAARGFFLHYSGTLLIVHYCALTFTLSFQVTVPVCQAVRKRRRDSIAIILRRSKLWEALLFLILFLCPILNSWEPFLPQLPSYGNYGPLCFFCLELTDNCTTNTSNALFLQTIPFAVVCFGYFGLSFTVLLALCRMYCKFRTKTIGSRIIRVIPALVILTIMIFMFMMWLVLSTIRFSKISSFSAWLGYVTVTLASTIGILVAVGVYVHFPMQSCLHCRKDAHQERGRIELQVIHPPEVAHRNTPPVINPHLLPVNCHKYPTHTTCNVPHSPVTTECMCTPLIAHPPELEVKNPTHTTCSISHEPITTTSN